MTTIPELDVAVSPADTATPTSQPPQPSGPLLTVPSEERRAHPRILIDSDIAILAGGQVVAELTAIDLSTGGMQAHCNEACLEQLVPDGHFTPGAATSVFDFRTTLSPEYGGALLHGRLRIAWIRTMHDDRVLLGLAFTELSQASLDAVADLAESAMQDALAALAVLTRPCGMT